MTNAQKYDLMAAVRGPDNDNETFGKLKFELTGRVRVILFEEKDIKGISNSEPLTNDDLKNIAGWVKKIACSQAARHYLRHIREAIAASRTHKVWGKKADKLTDLLGNISSL